MAFFSLNDIFGNKKPSGSQPQIGFNDLGSDELPGYKLIKSNWFTSKPYGFKFTPRNGKPMTMFLPISPTNLQIQTGFATNAVATLYGTVEEHSPVRYFDISIEGNTGMAPRFVDVDQTEQNLGRTTFPVAQTIAGSAGGLFTKTLSLVDKIRNTASDLINGPQTPNTGIYVDQTGYAAFHNLYRFLLKYKEDVSEDANSNQPRAQHPLTFFNYKDNNQYDVVVRGFTLRRSADNPMVYNYSIQLRGYNIRSVSNDAKDLTAERLKLLGLDGVDGSSILSKVKGTSNAVKGILGPLGAGINILGR